MTSRAVSINYALLVTTPGGRGRKSRLLLRWSSLDGLRGHGACPPWRVYPPTLMAGHFATIITFGRGAFLSSASKTKRSRSLQHAWWRAPAEAKWSA